MIVRRSFAAVWRTLNFDPALTPYYLLLKLWSVPSTSEVWLRLPSVVAMATAVTATALLATRSSGRRGGLMTALVMLLLTATTRYGQEARPYALSTLFVVLAVLCWEDDRLVTSRWQQARLAAVLALAGAAHPYALLVLPVLLVASRVLPASDRRRVGATATSGSVALLVLSPWLVLVAQRAKGIPNAPPVNPVNIAEEALRLPVGVLSPRLAPAFAVAVLGLAAAGLVLAWRREGFSRDLALLAGLWLCIPPLCLCIFQMATGSPGLLTRYWLLCLPALALAAGCALDLLWTRGRAAAVVCAVVLCGLAFPTQLSLRGEDGHSGERWRHVDELLALPALRDAPLLTIGGGYRAVVSNHPQFVARMPLVLDPVASGRVNPRLARPGSDVFRTLTRDHDVIVALQPEPDSFAGIPTRRAFTAFPRELRFFPGDAVHCSYFGEPLGIFMSSSSALGLVEAETLAQQIMAVAPGQVQCAVRISPRSQVS